VADVDTTAEEVDESTAEPEGTVYDSTLSTRPWRRRPAGGGSLRRLLVPIVLAVFFLGSAGMGSWAYLTQLHPDLQTDSAAAAATIKPASDGSIAVLSYSPESLDKDFAAARNLPDR
jgi:Mce-associated membrane protein